MTPGLYRHFKGGEYLVLFEAKEATNGRDESVVAYASLTDGKVYTPVLKEFEEKVAWPDGVERPRFLYIG